MASACGCFFASLRVVADAENPESFDQAPPIEDALINWLDGAFPDRCVRRGETIEDAHRRAGARDVVDRIKAVQSFQRGN